MGSRETASPAAPPPDRPVIAGANPEESPPGLDRVRRFLRTPVIRGTWLWIRQIGRWVLAAWRWLRKNAGPMLRGLAQAATTGAEAARRAAEAGRIAREGGKRIGAWARRRRAEGARGGFQDTLEDAEAGARTWGGRLDREATDAGAVLDSVGKFADALAGGGGLRDAGPRKSLPASGGGEPASVRASAKFPETPAPPQLAEPAAPTEAAEAEPPERRHAAGTVDERFRDLLARARQLGRRRPRGPLRKLIVEMVVIRKSATAGELAGWLGMQKKHLKKSHLRPLLQSGELRLLYPEDPTHPDQAYAVGDGAGLPSSGELG